MLGKTGEHDRNGVVLLITAVFSLAVLAFVFFLIRGSMATPTYTVDGRTLTISGQFGVELNLEGTSVTHVFARLPEIETRTNGAAVGTVKKGTFKINGAKAYMNVMDENAADYILITDQDGYAYYIACETTEETDALYDQITAALG